jgi:hypothetical protein
MKCSDDFLNLPRYSSLRKSRRLRAATLGQFPHHGAGASTHVQDGETRLYGHALEQQQAEGRGPPWMFVVEFAEHGCVESTFSRYFMAR